LSRLRTWCMSPGAPTLLVLVSSFRSRVSDFGFRVSGFGFRVEIFGDPTHIICQQETPQTWRIFITADVTYHVRQQGCLGRHQIVIERVERGGLWEGYHESRRCSRNTYPESYITKYTSIRRETVTALSPSETFTEILAAGTQPFLLLLCYSQAWS